jgi:hypothetical protein
MRWHPIGYGLLLVLGVTGTPSRCRNPMARRRSGPTPEGTPSMGTPMSCSSSRPRGSYWAAITTSRSLRAEGRNPVLDLPRDLVPRGWPRKLPWDHRPVAARQFGGAPTVGVHPDPWAWRCYPCLRDLLGTQRTT